jgi:hypothetical protein
MLNFGRAENLLGVVKKYIIWGFEIQLMVTFIGLSVGDLIVIPLVIIMFREKGWRHNCCSKKNVPQSERFFDNHYKSSARTSQDVEWFSTLAAPYGWPSPCA